MRKRTILAALAAPAILAATLGTTAASAAANGGNGQNGTTLSATVTGSVLQDRAGTWTLSKTGKVDKPNIWQGDGATITWTVNAATQPGLQPVGSPHLVGQVNVNNGGSVDTKDLIVKVFLEQKTGQTWTQVGPTSDNLVPATAPVLGFGKSAAYTFDLPVTGYQAGATYRVEAPITITNHSSSLGTPFGPTPKGDVGFKFNDVVQPLTVTDAAASDSPWTFDKSGSKEFTQQVTPAELGDHEYANTAKADGLPDATAKVNVKVWGLNVAKTADAGSFDRTYQWSVGGQDQTIKVKVGQDSNYQVPVTVKATDGNWQAGGTIEIKNPAPIDAQVTNVEDLFGDGSQGTVTDWSGPQTIKAGDTLVLHWTAKPGSAAATINTATVTIDTKAQFKGWVDVNFDHAQMTEIGKTATIHNHASIEGATGDGSSSAFDVTGQLDQG